MPSSRTRRNPLHVVEPVGSVPAMTSPPRQLRRVELVRALWGMALLLKPRLVMGRLGVRTDAPSVSVARILGARHLGQAALSGIRPSARALRVGAGVDSVHAMTSLALAAFDRRRARAGLADAAIAATWALASVSDLPRASQHRSLAVVGAAPHVLPLRRRP